MIFSKISKKCTIGIVIGLPSYLEKNYTRLLSLIDTNNSGIEGKFIR